MIYPEHLELAVADANPHISWLHYMYSNTEIA